MPSGFAPQLQHTQSAITPSLFCLLPIPEQVASRTRRNTAPSSSRTAHLAAVAQRSASAAAATAARHAPPPAFPSRRLVPQAYRSASSSYASPEDLARDVARLPDSSPQQSTSSSTSLHRQLRHPTASGSRLADLCSEEASTTQSRQASSAPNPQQHPQPRYTGKDRTGLLDWVAQVNLHTPSPPRASQHPSSASFFSSSSSSSPSRAGFRLSISKPSPAPPVMTHSYPTASLSQAHYTSAKILVDVDMEQEDREESATLVHPPSSSALDTLSLSIASFHQFIVADEVRGASVEESDESEDKTMSPPAAPMAAVYKRTSRSEKKQEEQVVKKMTTTSQRKKNTFTLIPAYADSDCSSESDYSDYDDDEESESQAALSRTSSFACRSAASLSSPPSPTRNTKSQVFSLEDLLAIGNKNSLPSPVSHFSDDSDSEFDEQEEDEEQEGERDCDLWQNRGRRTRATAVGCAH